MLTEMTNSSPEKEANTKLDAVQCTICRYLAKWKYSQA